MIDLLVYFGTKLFTVPKNPNEQYNQFFKPEMVKVEYFVVDQITVSGYIKIEF